MYLVHLSCAAEGRWLAGPTSPLADPDIRPLGGFTEHLGDGWVRLDGDALRTLALLPPHADGRVEWDEGGPVISVGGASFHLVEESTRAHS